MYDLAPDGTVSEGDSQTGSSSQAQTQAVAQTNTAADTPRNNQPDAATDQASEAEHKAVAALKDLGAEIKLNDSGEVWEVRVDVLVKGQWDHCTKAVKSL